MEARNKLKVAEKESDSQDDAGSDEEESDNKGKNVEEESDSQDDAGSNEEESDSQDDAGPNEEESDSQDDAGSDEEESDNEGQNVEENEIESDDANEAGPADKGSDTPVTFERGDEVLGQVGIADDGKSLWQICTIVQKFNVVIPDINLFKHRVVSIVNVLPLEDRAPYKRMLDNLPRQPRRKQKWQGNRMGTRRKNYAAPQEWLEAFDDWKEKGLVRSQHDMYIVKFLEDVDGNPGPFFSVLLGVPDMLRGDPRAIRALPDGSYQIQHKHEEAHVWHDIEWDDFKYVLPADVINKMRMTFAIMKKEAKDRNRPYDQSIDKFVHAGSYDIATRKRLSDEDDHCEHRPKRLKGNVLRKLLAERKQDFVLKTIFGDRISRKANADPFPTGWYIAHVVTAGGGDHAIVVYINSMGGGEVYDPSAQAVHKGPRTTATLVRCGYKKVKRIFYFAPLAGAEQPSRRHKVVAPEFDGKNCVCLAMFFVVSKLFAQKVVATAHAFLFGEIKDSDDMFIGPVARRLAKHLKQTHGGDHLIAPDATQWIKLPHQPEDPRSHALA